jgi:hypothetical protein
MNDRPRAERRKGESVLFDKPAGYVSKDLSYDELLAIAEECLVLARIARMC